MSHFRALIWLLQLLSITIPPNSSFGINIIAVTDDKEMLIQCTYSLVSKYFESGEILSGSLLIVSLTSATPYLQNRMLQAFHLDPNYSWTLMVRDPSQQGASIQEESSSIVHEKPQTYFVVVENLDDDDMEDVFNDWKSMENWNPLAQFVVFFSTTEETEEEMTELMVEILLMFMTRKIFNINVIAQTVESGNVFSKTAFPYEPENHCGSRVIAFQTLDVCDTDEDDDSGTVYVEEYSRGLFLDKIPKDLSGCPLTAYSRSWEPYMFVEDGRMKGIEWMLVQTIAETLHIGIEITIQNKTLFHIFQGLIDGEVDIIIGGIDEDPNLSHLVSASVPYLQDDLTWCVTKADKIFHWLNFIRVFNNDTYIGYIGFLALNMLVVYIIQKRQPPETKIRRSFIDIVIKIIGFALNQSVRKTYFHTSLRVCMLMSLVAALLMGSIYNSFLISTLTNPSSSPQINKAIQLLEHEMLVTGSVDIIRHLNKDEDIFKYIRHEFLICYNIEECLQKAAYNQHLAVAVSRQYSIYNPRIPRENLYCFDRDENIYTYLVTMLMPNKFHLFHQINPIIQYVIESGHLLKWTRDLELERMLKAGRNPDGFKNLKVDQVLGVFLLGGIFIGFASVVLVVEIVVNRMSVRGTKIRIMRILHEFFSN